MTLDIAHQHSKELEEIQVEVATLQQLTPIGLDPTFCHLHLKQLDRSLAMER
jgi:hypothetical protein